MARARPALRVHESDDLSPAEEALLSKFKTIKHHKELADLKRKKSENLDDANVKKDARARAIDIIRARRAQEEGLTKDGAAVAPESVAAGTAVTVAKVPKPAPKMKIKLATIKPVKPTKRKNNLIDDSDSEDAVPVAKAELQRPRPSGEEPSTSKTPPEQTTIVKKKHVIGVKRRAHPQKPKQLPTILVEHLPPFFGKEELLQYFGVQCQLQVTGIHVFDGCSSALVSFSTPEQGEMVLVNAPSMMVGDRPLSVRWATQEDINASEQNGDAPMTSAPSDPRKTGTTPMAAPSDPRMQNALPPQRLVGDEDRDFDDHNDNDDDNDDNDDDNDDDDDDNDDDPRARNVVDYFDL